MHLTLVAIHVLAATVWTGGHLVLALGVLPGALRSRSPEPVARFEASFERIAIPSLLIQVVTGVWLALLRVPDFTRWFMFQDRASVLILAKLGALMLTIGLAVDARARLVPGLDEAKLPALALHIIPVTLLSVIFVVLGVLLRAA